MHNMVWKGEEGGDSDDEYSRSTSRMGDDDEDEDYSSGSDDDDSEVRLFISYFRCELLERVCVVLLFRIGVQCAVHYVYIYFFISLYNNK